MTMGRTPKIGDPDRAKRATDALAIGATVRQAAAAAGISETTFYEWQATDADFAEAVARARATAELRMVGVVQQAATTGKDWRAAAWYLERRRPDEWGRRDVVDLNHYAPRAEVEEGVQKILDALRAELPPADFERVLLRLDPDGGHDPEPTGD